MSLLDSTSSNSGGKKYCQKCRKPKKKTKGVSLRDNGLSMCNACYSKYPDWNGETQSQLSGQSKSCDTCFKVLPTNVLKVNDQQQLVCESCLQGNVSISDETSTDGDDGDTTDDVFVRTSDNKLEKMQQSVIIDNALCYVQTFFGCQDKNSLTVMLAEFFPEDVLETSKQKLWDIINICCDESGKANFPRYTKRTKSNNKRKLCAQDLIEMWSICDRVMQDRPLFATTNLSAVPTLSEMDVDVKSLMNQVRQLKVDKLSGVEDILDQKLEEKCKDLSDNIFNRVFDLINSSNNKISGEIKSLMSGIGRNDNVGGNNHFPVLTKEKAVRTADIRNFHDNEKDTPGHSRNIPDSPLLNATVNSIGAMPIKFSGTCGTKVTNSDSSQPNTKSSKTFAQVAERDKEKWTLVSKLKQKNIKLTKGAALQTDLLQGVAHQPKEIFREIFVSRLNENTTAESLKAFMEAKGVEVKKCFILTSKVIGTVSARVWCQKKSIDVILSEDFWPCNIQVRPWIFKPRNIE